jgi:hypothetical protein
MQLLSLLHKYHIYSMFIRYMEWQTLWHWIKTWCKALS